MGSITVLKTGFSDTIQDIGRLESKHLGVPESGAMDTYAFSKANQLLNNSPNAASLEITMVGPTLRFDVTTRFVLTGGSVEAQLNDRKLEMCMVYLANEGDILVLGKVIRGFRTYMSVEGGFLASKKLGSCSYYPALYESPLIYKNAILSIQSRNSKYGAGARVKMKHSYNPDYFNTHIIEVMPGPEYDLIPEIKKKELATRTFTISPLHNRMAIQLAETISIKIPEIKTGHVLPGTIQCTPSGRLILLMRDCQITGGYARILQISREGLDILAQKKSGDTIQLSL